MAKIAKRYLELDAELESVVAYLTDENRARLSIPDHQHQQLLTLLGEWVQAFGAYTQACDERTQPINAAAQRSHKQCLDFIHGLRQQLKHNLNITLTPEDYEKLRIHHNKSSRRQHPHPTPGLRATSHVLQGQTPRKPV